MNADSKNLTRRDLGPNYQPWANSPLFQNFPDDNTVNTVVNGFGDMFKLVVAALSGLETAECGNPSDAMVLWSMFDRYFQLQQFDRVTENYQRLLGLKQPEFPGPVTRATYLDVFFGNRPLWRSYPSKACDYYPRLEHNWRKTSPLA